MADELVAASVVVLVTLVISFWMHSAFTGDTGDIAPTGSRMVYLYR